MYKLLALDLDGTVLNSQRGIHPEVKQAIQQLKEKYPVLIVTGRHHTAAKPYYVELGLDTPIICCNGTYVYDYANDEVLVHNALQKQVALEFIDRAQQANMKLLMYVTDAMLYSRRIPVGFIGGLVDWANQYQGEVKPQIYQVDEFEEHANQASHIWKFVVEGEPQTIKQFSSEPWVSEHFSGEQSWHNRVDFSARGNSKGGRLAEIVAQLGLQPEQVVAVGDNHNDVSMLNYAGLGVAMNNAADEIKQQANAVSATDNDGSGLAELIYQTFKL